MTRCCTALRAAAILQSAMRSCIRPRPCSCRRGAVCPLYWYTDQYLCNAHVQGLLSGPLGAQYLMAAQVQK